MENSFTLSDFNDFNGGWSLTPYSIYFAMKYCLFNDKIRILEFGSGEGTNNLINVLKQKKIDFDYTSIEHDVNFAKHNDVNYFIYNLSYNYTPSDIDNVSLNLNGYYDLVIIDGPHGVGRAMWYKKIKDYVKKDTVILVDDFHHYLEFGTELDKIFSYELINEFNIDNRFSSEIINCGLEKVDEGDERHCNKTHKVIKLK